MSVRDRLNKLEKAVHGKPGGKTAAARAWLAIERRHRAECVAWKRDFIAGRAGRMPYPKDLAEGDRGTFETLLRGGACLEARFAGVIAEDDYLPGMADRDREFADRICVGINACARREDEAAGGLTDADIAAMSDEEIDTRIAEARRRIAEADGTAEEQAGGNLLDRIDRYAATYTERT